MEKENNKEQINYKELIVRLYEDGQVKGMATQPLTADEAIQAIAELILLCCNNLHVHPFIFHTSLQNLIINVLFSGNEEAKTTEEMEEKNIQNTEKNIVN